MPAWILLGLHLALAPAFAQGPEAGPDLSTQAEGEAVKEAHDAIEDGHGESEEHGIPSEALFFTLINLTLFIGLMVYFARRPVTDALKSRALEVRSGLDEAARLQQDAQQRFADVESRLVALDRQVEEMKADAEAEAARESKVLDARAEADAARLKETAERTIREETQRATNTIRAEAAAMAVELARGILRREVNPDDQQRLARQFLDAVKKEADHG